MDQLAAQDRKRLLKVTSGNLRQSHLYVTGHYDFFPEDCFGASKKANGECRPIQIELDGFADPIDTDIGCEKKTGKPRKFFRERALFRKFFEHHGIRAGDQLSLERLGKRRYRLSVEGANGLWERKKTDRSEGCGVLRRHRPRSFGTRKSGVSSRFCQ